MRDPNSVRSGSSDQDPPDGDLSRRARGRWGEDLAAREYRRRGFELLARNWSCPLGELDLVLRRERLIVFCEVKARRTASHGGPLAAVDERKRVRVRRLAAAWLAAHDVHGVDVRFDVAAITGVRLEIVESAF